MQFKTQKLKNKVKNLRTKKIFNPIVYRLKKYSLRADSPMDGAFTWISFSSLLPPTDFHGIVSINMVCYCFIIKVILLHFSFVFEFVSLSLPPWSLCGLACLRF
jgi:hypothetical protein